MKLIIQPTQVMCAAAPHSRCPDCHRVFDPGLAVRMWRGRLLDDRWTPLSDQECRVFVRNVSAPVAAGPDVHQVLERHLMEMPAGELMSVSEALRLQFPQPIELRFII